MVAAADSLDQKRRVAAWSHGKGFVELFNTLGEFEQLRQKGSPPLRHDADAAALKKAYHRASLSLHPDRLQGLSTARRAEAEEVFKVLSAAYATAKEAEREG